MEVDVTVNVAEEAPLGIDTDPGTDRSFEFELVSEIVSPELGANPPSDTVPVRTDAEAPTTEDELNETPTNEAGEIVKIAVCD